MNEETGDELMRHQYILHAVWKVTEDHHGHKHTRRGHRVIHSEWEGEWDEKAIITNFVRQEHPDWLPEGFGEIGVFEGSVELTMVTVFHLAPGSTRNDDAWWEWLDDTKKARKKISHEREREADMATIERLKKKWGLSEQAEEG